MKNNKHFTDSLFEEFNYFDDEVDNILTEDLDTMLKYYNNLQNWDKQELLKFLTKDLTWNNNKEQGQYSKWILDKLNRNLLNSSHLGHLHDVLKRFEENKKYLKNKDINKFRSIQEIDAYLNDDNNYNELSHSQIVRQHRKDKQNVDLDNEAELIYKDSDWEIWIPKTYAASCKLGQGSSWCTASTETSEYFDEYSSEGNLYIILNKNNEKEKYQFHIESESYMNIDDEEINLVNIIERENNKKWVNALRQYDEYFDNTCEYSINKSEEVREKFNDFSQKINSLEIIKYPMQKDIIEEFKKFTRDSDSDSVQYKYLTQEDFNKIQNIKLEIENSLREIEARAFNNIDWINQVIFEKNSKLSLVGLGAFEGCKNLIELELPDSITEIRKRAFNDCPNLENIKLSKNVKVIDEFAFRYCSSLTSIAIPDSVTSIGEGAFAWCRNLRSVTIGNSMTSIERCVFWNCASLTNIVIGNSVTNIGLAAFQNCSSLTSIEIPNSTTNIREAAFWGCKNLTDITIPNSVTSIGKNAFHECPKLVIKTSNPYVINYCIENDIKYEKIN